LLLSIRHPVSLADSRGCRIRMVDGAFALIKGALSCVLLQFCYVLIRIVGK